MPLATDRRFRFHLLGLAYLPTRPELSCCAFTQKIIKFAPMLREMGHEVIFYGGEGSQVNADEFVQVNSEADRRECYGDYDYSCEFFRYNGSDQAHRTFNHNAIEPIRARQKPGDFLLCTMGTFHQPIAAAEFQEPFFRVEPGVGYEGIFAPFRAFESYAWMHYLYGRTGVGDGSWYDAVIPNYFEPTEFSFTSSKQGYGLYIGRIIRRKGVDVAVQVSRELGMRLVIAGQGSLRNIEESLDLAEPHVEFVGSVGPERRATLMGNARLVFAPTYYIEPFGRVAVEAKLCGTPVLTTDWGAFSETVLHGVTGFRCRTLDDFVWAARNVDRLNPLDCRTWAVANYSTQRVQLMFQEYFEKIADVGRQGWYEPHPERDGLSWLTKYPPEVRHAD